MPFVVLTTNIPDNKLPSDLNQSITQFLAGLFNKPAPDFSVIVDAGKRFTIGGTSEPAVMLVIKSIGNYNETANIKYAKEISEFVQKNVGVGNDRCVIHFFPFETSEVSRFGTTIQEYRKNKK
uniref:L-dopachrome isomerase n=1 Tax=Acrobeloides nanus TaxID=290746 RepID=A0A914C261_9BILA